MKYTKTIKVDFYVCDGESINYADSWTCRETATELFRSNLSGRELHLCKECPKENKYLVKTFTYMGKIK